MSVHQGRDPELRSDPSLELPERCPHCGEGARYSAVDYTRGRLVGPCGPIAAEASA